MDHVSRHAAGAGTNRCMLHSVCLPSANNDSILLLLFGPTSHSPHQKGITEAICIATSDTGPSLVRSPRRMSGFEHGLLKAQQEVLALRRINAALQQRLERKDRRIEELLEEKFALADQLQQQQQRSSTHHELPDTPLPNTIQQEEPSDTLATSAQEEEEEEKLPRIPGIGFTLIPFDATAVARGRKDDTAPGMKRPTLREWAAERKPSKLVPELLRNGPWVLSKVPPGERMAYVNEGEEDTVLGSGGLVGEALQETPASPVSTLDVGRSRNKRRRLDSDERETYDRRPGSAVREPVQDSHGDAPSPSYHHPHCSSNPSHHHNRRLSRRSVCVHCWITNQTCTLQPTCGPCRSDGARCVRKLCEVGEGCPNPRYVTEDV